MLILGKRGRNSRRTGFGGFRAPDWLHIVCTGWLLFASSLFAENGVNVLTYHNDNGRTGQNLSETILTPDNVNQNSFGKLFAQPVDGEVYGQPLYLSQVQFPDATRHNMIFAATENDSVYAFDADNNSGANSSPIWHVSFINPDAGITTMPVADLGLEDDATPNIGITSTMVIDPTTQTLFVVAKTKEVTPASVDYRFRLHALDVRTGAEKFGGPVLIQATVRGTGIDADSNTNVVFYPLLQHQRTALLLVNGMIYFCWASIGDLDPYHGWMMGYDARTLQQSAVFNVTPNGSEGGIWQAGCGASADANGNIYVSTGNGTFDFDAGPDYGDTVLKLVQGTNGLSVLDSFTPYNQAELSFNDLDLGSGGVLIVPDQPNTTRQMLVTAGKEGTIYVLDQNNMGHFQADSDSQAIQTLHNVAGASFGVAAYFNHGIYYGGVNDALKLFSITNGMLSGAPVSRSAHVFGYGGTTPSISADGTNNAIVWALDNAGFSTAAPAVLHALDGNDLSQELYTSAAAGSRDAAGVAVRFTVPTVVNGKVYVGGKGALTVYGLTQLTTTPEISPTLDAVFTNSVAVTITDATAGSVIHYTLDGSSPTAASSLYSGTLKLTQTATVKAVAIKPGLGGSVIAEQTYLRFDAIGDGTGLRADYFSGALSPDGPPTLTRADAQVDFIWGGSAPDPRIEAGHFAVRWTGQMQPQFTETYTFSVLASDGARLSIDDDLIIDQWIDQPPTEMSGTVSLIAGQKYDLTLEYYEGTGNAVAQLYWSSPSTLKSIVPISQLYPATNGAPWLVLQSPVNNATYVVGHNLALTAVASDVAALTNITYFIGDEKLGTVSGFPYTLVWTNVAAGRYIVRAEAIDAYGTVLVTPSISFIVAPALQIERIGTKLVITWPTTTSDYALEESTALPPLGAWTQTEEVPVVGPSVTTVTTDLAETVKFYRLRTP